MSQLTIEGPVFTTSIDLDQHAREAMIGLLNQQLADTFDLYSHTKQAHWNVKGMQFHALHELFDKLAAGLEGYIDMIAERAVFLGGSALGTARMAAGATRLEEYPIALHRSEEHVKALVSRYAAVAATTRKAIKAAETVEDTSTADLFTEVSRGLDKSLWFLEAHVQG
jgi:starvation-inducible DNA-binding protein